MYGEGSSRVTDLTAAIPPAGPQWSFDYPGPDGGVPGLRITLPQKGEIHYTFVQSESPGVYGMLTGRSTWDNGSLVGAWTFVLDPGDLAPSYRWIIDGPDQLQHV